MIQNAEDELQLTDREKEQRRRARKKSIIQNKYQVLSYLRRGAFGDVLMVRGAKNDRTYGIKYIELDPQDTKMNWITKRRVALLANLNHEHLARCDCAWIEFNIDSNSIALISTTDKEDAKYSYVLPYIHDPDFSDKNEWDSYIDILSDNRNQIARNIQMPTGRNLFLCMQMTFYDRTLRNAMDEGLCEEDHNLARLLRQIIEGFTYMSKKYQVHTDVNPKNIFLDVSGNIKIGNFGLPKIRISSHYRESENDFEGMVMPRRGFRFEVEEFDWITDRRVLLDEIEEILYMAPEFYFHKKKTLRKTDTFLISQRSDAAVKRAITYRPIKLLSLINIAYEKGDMYSVGVIFYEMLHNRLLGREERIQFFNNLRMNDIPLPSRLILEDTSIKFKLCDMLSFDADKRSTFKSLGLFTHSLITFERKNED